MQPGRTCIGILIGADHYWTLVTGSNCQGDGPIAIETRFGWVLSGPATGLLCGSTSMGLLSCHTLKTAVTLYHQTIVPLIRDSKCFGTWSLLVLRLKNRQFMRNSCRISNSRMADILYPASMEVTPSIHHCQIHVLQSKPDKATWASKEIETVATYLQRVYI